MLFIHICIPNSYVNLCQNQSCQFQTSTIMSISNFYDHVNFKLLQSCKFQDSCSHVSQFQFVFAIQSVSVIGQVASSHPRTTCACQFTLVIGQVASSHTRTACTCRYAFILVIGQAASSNTRTACTYALFLSSAKRLVRIQEQLVLHILFLSSAKRLVRIREQLVLLTLFLSSAKRLVQLQKNSLCPSTCQFSRSSS